MTQAEEYRMRAAEVRRQATQETSPVAAMELESIAAAYLRLASRADRIASFPRLRIVSENRTQL